MEDQVSSTDPRASFQGRLFAGAPEPTFHLPAAVDPGEGAAPEDPQTSSADLSCWEHGAGWEEVRRCLDSLHYGDGVSARWVGASQDALEGEGGIHRADLVAPKLYGEVEDEDGEEEEEVSVALSAYLVTLPEGAQACHLLAWAHCLSIYCDGSVHP